MNWYLYLLIAAVVYFTISVLNLRYRWWRTPNFRVTMKFTHDKELGEIGSPAYGSLSRYKSSPIQIEEIVFQFFAWPLNIVRWCRIILESDQVWESVVIATIALPFLPVIALERVKFLKLN